MKMFESLKLPPIVKSVTLPAISGTFKYSGISRFLKSIRRRVSVRISPVNSIAKQMADNLKDSLAVNFTVAVEKKVRPTQLPKAPPTESNIPAIIIITTTLHKLKECSKQHSSITSSAPAKTHPPRKQITPAVASGTPAKEQATHNATHKTTSPTLIPHLTNSLGASSVIFIV